MARQSPRKSMVKSTAVQVTVSDEKNTKKRGVTTTTTTTTTTAAAAVAATVVEEKVKVARKAKRKIDAAGEHEVAVKEEEDEEDDDEGAAKKPAAKKRKTKAAKKEEEEAMPLAARTAVSSLKRAMYIGAHVSGAGGVHNSVHNAVHIGANAFALFLKSQRKWANPPLADEARDAFRAAAQRHGFDAARHVLPHGSYLVNLAQGDRDKAEQAYASFVDDLRRCEALGIELYNFHPGSGGAGGDVGQAVERIAAMLNRAHRETARVVTVLENMCGSGSVVGSRFEELRDVIALVEDKERVGVCLDTCHAFAAGYDLRTPEAFAATMEAFDRIVGLRYLKALHLNDSKAPLGSHRDLHANIGTGFLGLGAFHNVVNYAPFQHLPMVLETPIDEKGPDGKTVQNKQIWADEIKLLEGLIGADRGSERFRARERELWERGQAERGRIQGQVDRKVEKDAKKEAAAAKKRTGANGKAARAKKKRADEEGEEDGEDSEADEGCC